MSDFKTTQVLVMQNTPLKLQRSNWEQLRHFLAKKGTEYEQATSTEDILIQSTILQNLIKISKHIQKLSEKGKPMKSTSTIKLTPVEKYGLRFIIEEQYNHLVEHYAKDKTFFFAYLQPILDGFQQFDINNQGLITT